MSIDSGSHTRERARVSAGVVPEASGPAMSACVGGCCCKELDEEGGDSCWVCCSMTTFMLLLLAETPSDVIFRKCED